MHTKPQQPISAPAAQATRGETPLAQSAFSGEARLRELEHLAETARKVRDQAAAELTRNNGSTHHIARDRMSAAERMLRKTQQEIAQLREQLAAVALSNPSAAPQPAAQTKDFELAVMLGHSRARFNLDTPSQLTLQEQDFSRRVRDDKQTSGKRATRAASLWHTLTFGLLIAAGIGIGALATYGFINTGTLDGAARAVREGTTQMVDRLRGWIPSLALPATTGQATALTSLALLDTASYVASH